MTGTGPGRIGLLSRRGVARRVVAGVVAVILPALATAAPAMAKATNGSTVSVVAGNGTRTIVPGPAVNSGLASTVRTVAADGLGNVYFLQDSQVLKVDPQGQLTIVAGDGSSGSAVPGPALSSPMRGPNSLAVDARGNIYIADYSGRRVLKVDTNGELSLLAGTGVRPASVVSGPALQTPIRPEWVAAGPDGIAYAATDRQVVKIANGEMTVIAGDANLYGNPTLGGPATASALSGIHGITADAAGNVFIANNGSNCVLRVDATTDVLTDVAGVCGGPSGVPVPGPAKSSPVYGAEQIAVDRYGDLYIPSPWNYQILKVTAPSSSDPTLSILGGSPQGDSSIPTGPVLVSGVKFKTPYAVAVGPNLNVYIAENDWKRIAVISGVRSAPDAPANLTVAPGDGSADVSFDMPADDGGSAITGYEYSIDGGLTWLALPASGTPRLVATIHGLTPGKGYTIKVRAVNAIGGSNDASDVIAETVTPPAPVSEEPVKITDIAPGHETAGQTLQCSEPAWANIPTHISYLWTRDGVAIPGATHKNHTIQVGDEGHDLACTVSASDAAGTTHTTSTQIAIPLASRADCPAASGTLSGATLGPISLGETQEHARAGLPRYDRYSYHTDNFCLAHGHGIRVGYGSAALAAAAHITQPMTGQIVLALTANPHYALGSVHPGQALSTAAARLHLSKPLRSGKNTWYTIRGHASTGVLKVRHGTVEEVGIANHQLIGHRRSEQKLLHSF